VQTRMFDRGDEVICRPLRPRQHGASGQRLLPPGALNLMQGVLDVMRSRSDKTRLWSCRNGFRWIPPCAAQESCCVPLRAVIPRALAAMPAFSIALAALACRYVSMHTGVGPCAKPRQRLRHCHVANAFVCCATADMRHTCGLEGATARSLLPRTAANHSNSTRG
jgi:hypothetical protein